MGSSRDGSPKSRLPEDANRILRSLAATWDDVADLEALQVVPLKGAMTNEVYQIKWPTSRQRSRKVLVRIYGEGVDVFFDREQEIRTFEFMSRQGQGPRFLGRFSNGRVEEFIHARTLSAFDLRDPEISALIAAKMKEFHDLDMPGPKTLLLWDRLRNWLSAARRISSPDEADAFHLDAVEEEISFLKESISDFVSITFAISHVISLLIVEALLDYEYACYNHVAFDIANHFCEMAADYHTDTPHILDYTKYPGV
ncbi:hypothetical protein RJ639_012003 [Escallonia herrerae]|uniref:Choline kinase n=1 Tax=Escallonia herrerae TaxID=1293975 RepID=A0AA89AQ22_9ASTE|nr:hypothetical protein RJ639_012003 [Escallonia herrerae]